MQSGSAVMVSVLQMDGLDLAHQRLRVVVELLHDHCPEIDWSSPPASHRPEPVYKTGTSLLYVWRAKWSPCRVMLPGLALI